MSRCCSLQSGLAAPEHRKWRRVHGLQLPLHPQQIAGWFALILFAAASFLVLVPALNVAFQPLLAAVLSTLFALHLIAHLTALLLDPADPELRRLRPASAAVPEFDRSKHAHVIENGRCHLCNIETSGPRTKHCSVCNKCVGKFDHHCKWLNHCIGGRNYAAFLVCVVSAVGACLVIVGISVTELVYYHVDPTWLDYPWTPDKSLTPEIFLIIVGFAGGLAAVTAGLLLHLCLFHVYISVLGITTYEYIRNYRQLSSVTDRNNSLRRQQQKDIDINISSRSTITGSSFNSSGNVNNCWKSSRHPLSRSDPEIGYDKKCSVETIEGTLGRDINTNYRNNCFTLDNDSVGRTSQNGFNKSYSKSTGSVTVISDRNYGKRIGLAGNSRADRRVCHGCRYCTNKNKDNLNASDQRTKRRVGWFFGFCGGYNINNNGDNVNSRNEGRRIDGPPSPPPAPRRNQVQPTSSRSPPRRSTSLPALPPPTRRQMQAVSLKELGDVLAYVQQQPQQQQQQQQQQIPSARRNPSRRYVRRKSIPSLRPTMSPTLSPIHESGLSNPGTPQPAPKPRQGVWMSPNNNSNGQQQFHDST